MARTKSYPDDLRDRLVAAALERLTFEGPEHVSLRELAASVDTSTNAIYSIFGGKEALMSAVVAAGKDDLRSVLEEAVAPGTVQALLDAGHAYRRWAHQHPSLYRLMFDVGVGRGPVWQDPTMMPLHGLLEHLQEVDVVRPCDPDPLCLSLWASMHGFVLLEQGMWEDGLAEGDDLFSRHVALQLRAVLVDEELLPQVA